MYGSEKVNLSECLQLLSPARRSWGGVLTSPLMSVRRLSAFRFEFRSRSLKSMGVFFHIAHTHPLGGIQAPFGVYEL